jgi:hypothetical protein
MGPLPGQFEHRTNHRYNLDASALLAPRLWLGHLRPNTHYLDPNLNKHGARKEIAGVGSRQRKFAKLRVCCLRYLRRKTGHRLSSEPGLRIALLGSERVMTVVVPS